VLGVFVIILLAYLLGSIPFGLVLTKICGLGDIRNIGSGNIGATNVLRTGKKGLAALTLLCDCGKGAVAVLLAEVISPGSGPLAGLAVFMGHLFPIWLKFKGGKGVATALGVMFALSWPVGVIAIACWLFMALTFRYSSLSALVAAGQAPVTAYLLGYYETLWLTIVIVIMIFIKHRANIQRLLDGTETKIELKKK